MTTSVCQFCGAAASADHDHVVMSCIRNLVSQRDDEKERAKAAEAERVELWKQIDAIIDGYDWWTVDESDRCSTVWRDGIEAARRYKVATGRVVAPPTPNLGSTSTTLGEPT